MKLVYPVVECRLMGWLTRLVRARIGDIVEGNGANRRD